MLVYLKKGRAHKSAAMAEIELAARQVEHEELPDSGHACEPPEVEPPTSNVRLTSAQFRKFLVVHLPRRQRYLSHRCRLMCPTLPMRCTMQMLPMLSSVGMCLTTPAWSTATSPSSSSSPCRFRCGGAVI